MRRNEVIMPRMPRQPYLSPALLLRRPCVLELALLRDFAILADLVNRLELRLDLSVRFPAMPFALWLSLERPFAGWHGGCVITANCCLLLLSPLELAIVVLVQLIKRFRCSDLVVLEFLAAKPSRVGTFSLSHTGKTDMVLLFPFVESSAPVSSRELGTTFSSNHLDIIRTDTITLDEPLLFLIPGHSVLTFALAVAFVALQVEGDCVSLLGKG